MSLTKSINTIKNLILERLQTDGPLTHNELLNKEEFKNWSIYGVEHCIRELFINGKIKEQVYDGITKYIISN